MGCTGSCSMGGSRLLNGLFRGSDGESTLVRIGVCLSSPPDDLVGAGWACRLLPAASAARRLRWNPLGYGVIGNTTDSGSVILGSSPGTPADLLDIC